MRVRDVVELEELQQAGVRVVAGADDIDREIDWVHPGEIADIAKYLSGGEVLLTAGTGLGTSPSEHRRYVRELAAAGAAAVIIELGRSFREIPPEMVEEADRSGLILIELENEVPFVQITRAVHTSLVSYAYEVLARATEIEEGLTQLILDGSTLDAVMTFLAEQLRNPVILEDGGRRVIAYGRAGGSIAPVLRAWRDHSRDRAHLDARARVEVAETTPKCVWTSVALRGEIWGRLHVLELDSTLDDLARLTVGRAASAIALHLMSERGVHLSETAEQMLVADAVHESGRVSGREFLDKATGLGVPLEGELVVVAVAADGEAYERPPDQVLRDAMRRAGWPCVVGLVDDSAVAVAPALDPADLRGRGEKLLTALPPATHVGLSKPYRASLLPQAFAEARAARQLGPSADDGFLHLYDDLALYRLLAPLAPGPELDNFVESELGPLIAHDENHNSDLVKTLDAYLQANGSKTAAAQMLHLQRRSIYYRLERIEELLGRSIDLPAQRARLYVALRGNELLEIRAGARNGNAH